MFTVYYDSGVMMRNVYSSAVFVGVDLFGEDPMVKTAFLCVLSF